MGLLFYIASLFLVKIDTEFTYRWVSFVLWVAGVLLVLLAVIAKKSTWHKYHSESQHHVGRGAKNSCSQDDRNSRILALLRSELVPFLFIALLAVVSRSIFLENYPFVSMGDEVRDGGLNAAQIANGEIKNIGEILDSGEKILESEIVDFLLPDLKSELLLICSVPDLFPVELGENLTVISR